ncbi:MAG TPA: hypothetical protein VGH32_13450, partial [Pirellulales bacterium]
MRCLALCLSVCSLILAVRETAVAASTKTIESPNVTVTVESTLKTSGDHIRQFVFDADPDTYFA